MTPPYQPNRQEGSDGRVATLNLQHLQQTEKAIGRGSYELTHTTPADSLDTD